MFGLVSLLHQKIFLMYYIELSAVIAALTMLFSRAKITSKLRDLLPSWNPIHCPVCFSFWVSAVAAVTPMETCYFVRWLALVTFSNLWMLAIAKLYLAIDDMDYEPE